MSSCTNLIDHRCERIYLTENIWFVFLYLSLYLTLHFKYTYTIYMFNTELYQTAAERCYSTSHPGKSLLI